MTTAWRKTLNRNVKQMHPDYARLVYNSLRCDLSITGPVANWVREHLTGGYYSQAISIEVYKALYKRANSLIKVSA